MDVRNDIANIVRKREININASRRTLNRMTLSKQQSIKAVGTTHNYSTISCTLFMTKLHCRVLIHLLILVYRLIPCK